MFALGAAGMALPSASAEAMLSRAAEPVRLTAMHKGGGLVRINANENPLGPSKAALEAMAKLGSESGRYPWQAEQELIKLVASVEGVPASHVAIFNGSSDPLRRAVFGYASPTRSFVFGAPGYEDGGEAASVIGARSIGVPLTPTNAHDVAAMCTADPNAGVIYICNPNNPTGTTTPRAQILQALADKPKDALLLVDEAYIHLSDEETVAPLVASHPDLLVLRTFSKLYGMAGLRMGLAIAQPPVLDKLKSYGWLVASTTGIAAAHASVAERGLIAERRAYVRRAREETFASLDKMGVKFHRSVSNCFMMDAGRPAPELAKAMAAEGVLIGRAWPVWPTWARISVGTPEEMRKFTGALQKVMA